MDTQPASALSPPVLGTDAEAIAAAHRLAAAYLPGAAALFAQYSPVPQAQLAAMLRSHTHHEQPIGAELKQQLAAYADELRLVQVLRPGTDTARFSEKVFADVLSA